MLEWLLSAGDDRARAFLSQVDRARVVSRCGCGCASVDLKVDGVPQSDGSGVEDLVEYYWLGPGGGLCAVFAFASHGRLAGLETYSVDGVETPSELPTAEKLKPQPWGFGGG